MCWILLIKFHNFTESELVPILLFWIVFKQCTFYQIDERLCEEQINHEYFVNTFWIPN